MDDDTILETGTQLCIESSGVCVTVVTTTNLTPELAEHMMTRMRRELVAAARQLGLTEADDDASA